MIYSKSLEILKYKKKGKVYHVSFKMKVKITPKKARIVTPGNFCRIRCRISERIHPLPRESLFYKIDIGLMDPTSNHHPDFITE